MATQSSAKERITISLDKEVTEHFRLMAIDAGVPYQWLIRRVLRNYVDEDKFTTAYLNASPEEQQRMEQGE